MNQETIAKLNEIFDRGLCAGIGSSDGAMCIEAAIAWACGEPFSDKPSCVPDVVRAHSIPINDCSYWSSPKVRADSLRAYALNQLGCKMIDEKEFAKRLVIRNVVEVLPLCLRALSALTCLSADIKAALDDSIALCEAATDLYSASSAALSAKSAASSAALSAKSAALSAKSAAWSASSAAWSAASSAAWSASSAAWSAASSAALSAESAKSAAWSASSAAWSAALSAKSASSAAWSAALSAKSASSAANSVLVKAAAVANEVLESCRKDAGLL